MQKLRALLPGNHGSEAGSSKSDSLCLDPEVGFQITIETTTTTQNPKTEVDAAASNHAYTKTTVPELNVHLIAARHLPSLFGFKVVQGYLIKVKLFPGSKRLDSSIQTNTWPKFNENFRFPLAPDLKPSMKHSARRASKTVSEFTPEELFAGQFVVFTVYALLELPPASFNRFNKTYRSLRDKGSNLVQKVVDSTKDNSKDEKENTSNNKVNERQKRRKSGDPNPRDSMPPLTISESRRNIGSVTCYLEPKIFKRNPRTGFFSTEELWLPIKDITTTVSKDAASNLANSPKGVIELVLEVRDCNAVSDDNGDVVNTNENNNNTNNTNNTVGSSNGIKNPQWNRMTSEVKRKMGISNISNSKSQQSNYELRVTTARMRCNNKVKDELESTAGSVYVKSTIYDHGIYVDAWKSGNFYPSLSTKWDVNEAATLSVPLKDLSCLDDILIRTTLATKTKMNKKMRLGTVVVGAAVTGSGRDHMQLLRETPVNERVAMWHSYQ